MDASPLQLIILPAGIIAILFAIYLARDVLSRDTGTAAMQDVAGTIYEGATAFIRRQYTTIGDPRRRRRGRHRRRHRHRRDGRRRRRAEARRSADRGA